MTMGSGASNPSFGEGYLDYAKAAGIADADVYSWATLNAAPTTYFTGNPTKVGSAYKVTTDKIYLPPCKIFPRASGQLVSMPKGVLLDWEVSDYRAVAGATTVLSYIADIVHDVTTSNQLQAILYPNALNGATAARAGLDHSNMRTLMLKYDLLSMLISADSPNGGSSADITEMLSSTYIGGVSGTDYNRLMLTVGIGDATHDIGTTNANYANAWIAAKTALGYNPAIDIWPFYGTNGGDKSSTYNNRVCRVLGMGTTCP